MTEITFHEIIKVIAPWLAALAGGFVDYVTQIQRGTKDWSWASLLFHLFSAAFFGYLMSALALHLGYEVKLTGAAAGLGGFLGVRVVDLWFAIFNKPRSDCPK